MNYIFDKQGNYKGLRGSGAIGDEIAIEQTEVTKVAMDKCLVPNLVEGSIVEGATAAEIEAYNRSLVPATVSRMGLKLQLLEKRIEISEIIETINSIPDYMFPPLEKRKAITKFEDGAYFDRYNADLQLVATLVGLTQEDLDDIFINGNQY